MNPSRLTISCCSFIFVNIEKKRTYNLINKALLFVCFFSMTYTLSRPAYADIVPLDISLGVNYDGYISNAEASHAALYDPPSSWGFVSRDVGRVFGEHQLGFWGTYSWDNQSDSGLPVSGELSTNYGIFRLNTSRDAAPQAGFVLPPQGSTPQLSTHPNVVRAHRPHSPSLEHPGAAVDVTLPIEQHARYASINFLMSGSGNKTMLYALYDNGLGDVDRVLIYDSMGIPDPEVQEIGFPEPRSVSTNNPDLVSALRMDNRWENYEGRSHIRPGITHIWTFASPLALDSSRTLRGFTLAVYNEDIWKARSAFIYAASADRLNVPALSSAAKATTIAEDGSRYVSTHNNLLRKIDNNGAELWSQSLGLINSEPLIGASNTLFVGSTNAHVYSINADAGNVLWSADTQGAVAGLAFNNEKNTVFAITQNGWLYAFDLNGTELWRLRLNVSANATVNAAPIVSPASAPTDYLYIKDSEGRLYAVEPANPLQNREASVVWVR
ncbi:PQQ-binding-like beta-propeller repeat protein [Agarilytica rhodophyticola]|uniref:outer membrane protein assembly factor BamB family protein n=1 Tax=Agarilytica rhodophyticola TaxID=1737490 RepID=UPI000B345D79|nr:PQQ-binding-like beta-propeller repeat protein [Agarilytica rhodophyticola]